MITENTAVEEVLTVSRAAVGTSFIERDLYASVEEEFFARSAKVSEFVPFGVGARVRVFDHKGAFVDDAEVLSVKEREVRFLSGDTSVAEVELRSLQFEPGVVHTMVLVIELGWRVLGDDPLQEGVQCISLYPEAEYDLQIVE